MMDQAHLEIDVLSIYGYWEGDFEKNFNEGILRRPKVADEDSYLLVAGSLRDHIGLYHSGIDYGAHKDVVFAVHNEMGECQRPDELSVFPVYVAEVIDIAEEKFLLVNVARRVRRY